ncbi:Cutaneous T-cell lymphoma-associated antigen 5 [Myotis davidii]|uniref:Cutaneous T-cell lymphoma-associated antigen 5 n=1 Tax=Myotis davidii TaxID=225400 RepID=L5LNL1_MYODS|nr:Cutaneous T-cell lymphoma-associated antigen 5 [Myotis davidii]
MRGFEMEKKFFNVWRNMNSKYQFLNMYRKMVQDMNHELRRSTFYYENEIRYHQRRAEEACMAAKFTERKLEYLWRENDHNKQMLAKVKSKFKPFPGGPFVPAALPHSPQRSKMPGHGPSSPQEESHTVRAQESSVICSCDSASTSDGS